MLCIDNPRNIQYRADNSMEFVDAAARGDIAGVRAMLDKGMHPDTEGPNGWTALRKSAVGNRYEVAYHLLNRGASVDAASHTGQTALMMACAFGHDEMVSLLLFHGADPNLANCSEQTALMIAASDGHTRVVGALLDARPRLDVNRVDRTGRTALLLAVEYGHHNVAKMLEAAGAAPCGRQETRWKGPVDHLVEAGGVA